jgi:hypothetical protein
MPACCSYGPNRRPASLEHVLDWMRQLPRSGCRPWLPHWQSPRSCGMPAQAPACKAVPAPARSA